MVVIDLKKRKELQKALEHQSDVDAKHEEGVVDSVMSVVRSIISTIADMENLAAASVWLDRLNNVEGSAHLEEFKRDLSSTDGLMLIAGDAKKNITDIEKFSFFQVAQWMIELQNERAGGLSQYPFVLDEGQKEIILGKIKQSIAQTNNLIFSHANIPQEQWHAEKTEVHTQIAVSEDTNWYNRKKAQDTAEHEREGLESDLENKVITPDEFKVFSASNIAPEVKLQSTLLAQPQTNQKLLMQYIIEGKDEEVKKLLDAGVDPNFISDTLYTLAEFDGTDEYNLEQTYRFTPLHFAAHNGHLAIIRMLLEHGANLNASAQGEYGNDSNLTPLHLAALSKQKDIVQMLLARGANPNSKVRRSSSANALVLAIHGCGRNKPSEAIDVVKLLLKQGADPEWWLLQNMLRKTTDGYEVYGRPIRGYDPYPELIKTMLEYGADPNGIHTSYIGQVLIEKVLKDGREDLFWLLLEYGTDLTKKTWDNRDPYVNESLRKGNIPNILKQIRKKPENHLDILLQRYALEEVVLMLKKPYPALLHALFDYVVKERRLDALDSMLKNHTPQQLRFIQDKENIDKIVHCLIEDSLYSPVTKLSIIEKIEGYPGNSLHAKRIMEIAKKSIKNDSAYLEGVENFIMRSQEKMPRLTKPPSLMAGNKYFLFHKTRGLNDYAYILKAVDRNDYEALEEIMTENPKKDFNIKDESGRTLLDIAYKNKLLLSADTESKQVTIHAAYDVEKKEDEVERDENEKIFFLLLEKLDVNRRTFNNQSMLHIAAIGKAPLSDIVLFLLKGANIDVIDQARKKPVDYLYNRYGNLDPGLAGHEVLLKKGTNALFQPANHAMLEEVVASFSLIRDATVKNKIKQQLEAAARKAGLAPDAERKALESIGKLEATTQAPRPS